MCLTSLFSFLWVLPLGVRVVAVWGRLAAELRPVKAVYFTPVLDHLRRYVARYRRLTLRVVDAEDMRASGHRRGGLPPSRVLFETC